jgi:hypothetical protein
LNRGTYCGKVDGQCKMLKLPNFFQCNTLEQLKLWEGFATTTIPRDLSSCQKALSNIHLYRTNTHIPRLKTLIAKTVTLFSAGRCSQLFAEEANKSKAGFSERCTPDACGKCNFQGKGPNHCEETAQVINCIQKSQLCRISGAPGCKNSSCGAICTRAARLPSYYDCVKDL